MKILGVDPGSVSGALGLLDDNGENRVFDIPTVKDGINGAELARLVQSLAPDVAAVELVGARPHQGLSSTFKFGKAFGMILGVLSTHQIPFVLVTPAKWKGHFHLRGGEDNKEASRELAIRLYPSVTGLSRKKDQNRAEALLIARWRQETMK